MNERTEFTFDEKLAALNGFGEGIWTLIKTSYAFVRIDQIQTFSCEHRAVSVAESRFLNL